MGHFTAGKPQTTSSEDFQTTWMPAPTAAGEKTHKAEPMRRISARGPAKSHRISKGSSSKSQPRPQSIMSQGAPMASKFDMSGNANTFQDGPLGNNRMMDVSQYLYQQSAPMTTSPEMVTSGFYPQMDGMPVAGLAFNDFSVNQHVDPNAIPLDFDTSMSGGSPAQSWDNLSEGSCASREDVWPLALQHSPLTSVSSNSPALQSLDTFSLPGHASQPMMAPEDLEANMIPAMGDEQVSMPGWNGRRTIGEGESARDHPLYKNAYPKADGLFHCPWEGQASCNHKPEKLKCNYE